ncbi:hypothetical protein B0H14DRAFT_3035239 [Mycena olivaceomarginata]|nr:hypothetical protein B0H14DRAFT_3035239 [Mycena olivaceomarginata]
MHLFSCHPSITSPALLLLLSASSMFSLSFTHFFYLSSGLYHASIYPLQSMIPYCFPSHRASHALAAAPRPIPHPHLTQVLHMFYLWLRDDLRHDHDRFRPPPKPRDDLSSLRGYTSCRRRTYAYPSPPRRGCMVCGALHAARSRFRNLVLGVMCSVGQP